jgi:hypothetical protein
VARCIIVMQEPLSLPLVAPLPPNCIAHVKNLRAEMINSTLSRRYRLWLTKLSTSINFWSILTAPSIVIIML